jgi:hypothetical protein
MSVDPNVHVQSPGEYEHLPEDWGSYDNLQKMQWFLKHYGVYAEAGELDTIQDYAPADVKAAFAAWRREPDCPWHSVLESSKKE